jgi:Family of unknown function (DUF5681)
MTKRKHSTPSDYAVGYRRPPKATQFKAGESGNPKGRRKGSRPVGAVLQDIIQQKVSVTEGNKTRRIPALEVIIRRLTNDAMRSDPRAIKLLLSLVDRYGDSPETKVKLGEILAEDETILAEYLLDSASFAPVPPSLPANGGGDDNI